MLKMLPQRNKLKLNKYLIWIALCIPAIYIFIQYKKNTISYGEVIYQTGDWSVALLALALAVTPFRRVLPKAKWPRWLMSHRRAIGVASFGYAAFHTLTYLERKWGYDYILEEGVRPDLLTGWIALIIFLILAVTSNNKSVRLLKKNWQRLHRTVYIATALTFLHWVLTAFEPKTAYICLGLLCVIESLRFFRAKVR